MRKLFFSAILILLCATGRTQSPDKWTVALKANLDYAIQQLHNSDLNTGFGFDAILSRQLSSHLRGYGGWSWNSFAESAPEKIRFQETGYQVGLQYFHLIDASDLQYMVSAGAVLNHIEASNSKGETVYTTSHGLGWQLEAGMLLPLSKGLYLMPAIRFRSLSRSLAVHQGPVTIHLRYLSSGAGLIWTL